MWGVNISSCWLKADPLYIIHILKSLCHYLERFRIIINKRELAI